MPSVTVNLLGIFTFWKIEQVYKEKLLAPFDLILVITCSQLTFSEMKHLSPNQVPIVTPNRYIFAAD